MTILDGEKELKSRLIPIAIDKFPTYVQKIIKNAGFKEFIPHQAMLAKFLWDYPFPTDLHDDVEIDPRETDNYLICVPTATGKTFSAVLFACKKIFEEKGKVIITTPLRALASELYEKLLNDYQFPKLNVKVGISTGDFAVADDERLRKNDIIVTTYERCDSILTNNPEWIQDVRGIVVDEIHNVDGLKRGPKIEFGIAKAKKNKHIDFMGLSATVGNLKDVQAWLDATLIYSDFRLVPLVKGVLRRALITFEDDKTIEIKKKGKRRWIRLFKSGGNLNDFINFNLWILHQNTTVINFLRSRSYTQRYALHLKNVLEEKGVSPKKIEPPDTDTNTGEMLSETVPYSVAFHHAGVTGENRRFIEKKFKNNEINVIFSTPTLAAGVNLPARYVIVDPLRWEGGRTQLIPVNEFLQMAGRAGRPQYDDIGYGIIFALDNSDVFFERFMKGVPEPISSKSMVERELYQFIVNSIAAGLADSTDGILKLTSNLLSAYQFSGYEDIVKRSVQALIEPKNYFNTNLDVQFLEEENGKLIATDFAKITAKSYVHPITALELGEFVSQSPKFNDITIIHAITITPDFNRLSIREHGKDFWAWQKTYIEFENELFFKISNIDNPFENIDDNIVFDGFKTAFILKDWIDEINVRVLEDKYSVDAGLLSGMVGKQGTGSWLLQALALFARHFDNEKLMKWAFVLGKRMEDGIKQELIPLVALKGVSRARARALYDHGFKTVEDVANAKVDDLANINISKGIKRRVKLGKIAQSIVSEAKKKVSHRRRKP